GSWPYQRRDNRLLTVDVSCCTTRPVVLSLCRDQHVCEARDRETWRDQLRLPAAGPGLPRGRQGPPSDAGQPRPRGRAEGIGTTRPTGGQLRPAGPAAAGHPARRRAAAAGSPLPGPVGPAEPGRRGDPQRGRVQLTHGEVVAVLVANRLSAPAPLYDVAGWASGAAVHELLGVPAMLLCDDRLGRALRRSPRWPRRCAARRCWRRST